MRSTLILTLAVASLPMAAVFAQSDYAYGSQKVQNKEIDAAGNVSQTTVEEHWVSTSSNASPTTTDANAPADAQPAAVSMQPEGGAEADGQHSQEWYKSNLPTNRSVFNPETGKLEAVEGNATIQNLNAKALEKKTDK